MICCSATGLAVVVTGVVVVDNVVVVTVVVVVDFVVVVAGAIFLGAGVADKSSSQGGMACIVVVRVINGSHM